MENTRKRIALFGATGSIGTQALEVIAANEDKYQATILTAMSNHELLISQALKVKPAMVCIGDETKYDAVKQALAGTSTRVLAGDDALEELADSDAYDLMLGAIVGYAGLRPTLKAIEKGKDIALANKETLVVAGDIVMQKARQSGSSVIPVDSEHSAIYQCMQGEKDADIEKVILTASGGPFRGKKPNFLVNVKRDHALQHPNWKMGHKITIDSATLMNKGLEMIEAKWLFDLRPEQIEVVIHAQSIIHSMVQYKDGSIKAQLGIPDMKLPIQYAFSYPERVANDNPRFDYRKYPQLTFEEPDIRTFRNLGLAIEALEKGGNLACVMNAANEIAVWAFLKNRIGFLDMMALVEKTMNHVPFVAQPTLDDYYNSDADAREFAAHIVQL